MHRAARCSRRERRGRRRPRAYDNTLAESVIGLYKTEPIKLGGRSGSQLRTDHKAVAQVWPHLLSFLAGLASNLENCIRAV